MGLKKYWNQLKDGFIQGMKEAEAEAKHADAAEPLEAEEVAPEPKKRTRKTSTSRLRSKNPIVDAILEHEPFQLVKAPAPISHRELAKRWRLDTASKFVRSDAEHSNALLFGVIADRMIPAERAWRVPYQLADRLGHFDVKRIAKMKPADLRAVFETPTSLHRFNAAMAEAYIESAQHLVANHRGAAMNMWPPNVDAPTLLAELESLKGISHKLSAMTLQIIVRDLGVPVANISKVDIAVDRHVARVFLRTGLVGKAPKKVYRVGEIREDVIAVARKSLPQFPGAIDLGAFLIGKASCTHTDPNCPHCPLNQVCPQDRRSWAIGVAASGRVKAE
jgi:uncharacterized HhH-GPD family protein